MDVFWGMWTDSSFSLVQCVRDGVGAGAVFLIGFLISCVSACLLIPACVSAVCVCVRPAMHAAGKRAAGHALNLGRRSVASMQSGSSHHERNPPGRVRASACCSCVRERNTEIIDRVRARIALVEACAAAGPSRRRSGDDAVKVQSPVGDDLRRLRRVSIFSALF
jgi:hypothetical protein